MNQKMGSWPSAGVPRSLAHDLAQISGWYFCICHIGLIGYTNALHPDVQLH